MSENILISEACCRSIQTQTPFDAMVYFIQLNFFLIFSLTEYGQFGGKEYIFHGVSRGFYAARDMCKADDADLVKIESHVELDYINSFMRK